MIRKLGRGVDTALGATLATDETVSQDKPVTINRVSGELVKAVYLSSISSFLNIMCFATSSMHN